MKSGRSSFGSCMGLSITSENGGLVLGTGLFELVHPPEHPVVLSHLHANIWWGGFLFLFGAVYCFHFAPGRRPAV